MLVITTNDGLDSSYKKKTSIMSLTNKTHIIFVDCSEEFSLLARNVSFGNFKEKLFSRLGISNHQAYVIHPSNKNLTF